MRTRNLTDEMLEQYLDYITNPHTETRPYRFLTVESILKMEDGLISKRDYENYKKSINFIDKNFSIIISGLESDNISINKQCAEFLGYFHDKRSVDPLITSLKHPDRGFRSICIKSLIRIKKCSREPLINELKNPNKNVRRGAIKALNGMPDKRCFDLYIKLLEDEDWVIKYNAIDLLINIIPSNAIESICKLIEDDSARVRVKVAWAIWYLYRLNDIYNIDKNLDIAEFIRCHEIISKSVLKALSDENKTVRKRMMLELTRRVSLNVFSTLHNNLKTLLEEIKGEYEHIVKLDEDIIKLKTDIKLDTFKSDTITEKSKRLLDIWILRENLLNSVKNKISVADSSLKVVKKYDNDQLLIYIEDALKDEDSKIRELAIPLLTKLANYNVAPILKEYFDDEDPYVRKAVIHELGRIDNTSIQFIKKALTDESKLVRKKAKTILYRRGELDNYKKAYILEDASPEERSSYELWLSNLHKRNPMEFKENKNYIYMFLYETVHKFSEDKNIKNLLSNFEFVENSYNNTDLHLDLNNWKSGAYFTLEEYEKSFYYKKKAGLDSYEDLFIFAMLLDSSEKGLINGEIILNLSDKDSLSEVGEKYKNEIQVSLDEMINENYIKYNKHLISHFIHDHIFYSSKKDPDKLKRTKWNYICVSLEDNDLIILGKYFDDKYEFNELKFHYSREQKGMEYGHQFPNEEYFYFIPFPKVRSKDYLDDFDSSMKFIVPTIILKAFINYTRKLIRNAENKVRKANGLPEVGQNWINETLLFKKIKELFPNEIIIQHGKPSWLGQQHLDIFFPERSIGIEYQGIQHFKPVSYFGGKKAFKKLQKRDKRKKRLCDENNCELICISDKYDIQDVEEKIKLLISA
ncbi:HEAT repeat domain-containing protein [Methanobacterium sp. BAmetb5]|uniref:HEAT repeat domain-containing protein n=1 Tax=Methanobacterium sp. BAmetb5 TaxID=2025351 RepID=UPI000E815CA4|nr:HEAT repeat domain-containing protein [Methanobacterium sp. BAmetb5]AXV40431.1 MAG: hypothetical protein CIT02_08940 [Methanobacterium sp. BAmetb5]